MEHLTAAMLADSLARRSGVEGWEVKPKAPGTVKGTRIEYEMSVKPPPGWTIVHGEDGSITPCKLPASVSFSFHFGEGPVVK